MWKPIYTVHNLSFPPFLLILLCHVFRFSISWVLNLLWEDGPNGLLLPMNFLLSSFLPSLENFIVPCRLTFCEDMPLHSVPYYLH